MKNITHNGREKLDMGSAPQASEKKYAIAFAPLSNVFKTGHRIKLVIFSLDHARARDYDLAPESLGRTHAPWHLCSSKTTLHKVFHDGEHPSHLLLPVIPASRV